MKEFRKQHVMESKFHSFWTKSKCRLKNFVAALNQFSQFVQCVQIVGARVFEVMFSVTTVCLVQGKGGPRGPREISQGPHGGNRDV